MPRSTGEELQRVRDEEEAREMESSEVRSPSGSSKSAGDPRPTPPPAASDSPFSLLLFDISQQAQVGLENMMKIIGEVEQSASEIVEEIEKCTESATERKRNLEAEKGRFQKAALAMLELLDNEDHFDMSTK